MRIVGGRHRGLALAAPGMGGGDPAAHLRPTTDRVREAVFNLLLNGADPVALDGARVLDLFAGTGALGLEALSRGAALACLVDDGAPARALIRENIARMRVADRARVVRRDATRLGPNRDPGFALVFCDPPYGTGLGAAALAAARAGGWLAPGARIVLEDSAPHAAPAGFTALDQRRYGDTHVTLLRAACAR